MRSPPTPQAPLVSEVLLLEASLDAFETVAPRLNKRDVQSRLQANKASLLRLRAKLERQGTQRSTYSLSIRLDAVCARLVALALPQ